MKFTYCPPTKIDISKEDVFRLLTTKENDNVKGDEITVYNARLTSFFFAIDPKCFTEEFHKERQQEIKMKVDGTKIPNIQIHEGVNSLISVNFDNRSTSIRVTVENELFMFEVFITI